MNIDGKRKYNMKTFTFENHLGDTFIAKAENGLDLMEDANRKILWPNWKDGMWQQVSDTKFVWVLGNFFD
jgi:calcineurin-like phosphoesterase family protein